jgi:hypothetical protein
MLLRTMFNSTLICNILIWLLFVCVAEIFQASFLVDMLCLFLVLAGGIWKRTMNYISNSAVYLLF